MIKLAFFGLFFTLLQEDIAKVFPFDQKICRIAENSFAELQTAASKTPELNLYECNVGMQYIQDPYLLNQLPKATAGSLPVYLDEHLVIKDFKRRSEEGLRLGMKETISTRRNKEKEALRIIEINGLNRLIVPTSCVLDDYTINEKLPIQGFEESIQLYSENPEKFTIAVQQFTRFFMNSTMTDIYSDLGDGIPRYDNVVPYLVKEGDRWIGQLGLIDLEHLCVNSSPGRDDIKLVLGLFPFHHKEIFLEIFKEPRSIAVKEEAFRLAINFRYKEVIEKILSEHDISERSKEEGFKKAVTYDYVEIVELLILDNNISRKSKQECVEIAIKYGNIEILEILILDNDISRWSKVDILSTFVRYDRIDIVERFLLESVMNPSTKEWAFEVAAEFGHKEIVKTALLERGVISLKAKESAFVNAAESGHKEIVEIFLLENDMNSKIRKVALKFAARGGHKEIVEMLRLADLV
jgi:hypothetical protein